jgi:hypothetical protein
VGWLSRSQVALVLPVPVVIAGGFCYFAFVFYPASASAAADQRARFLGSYFLTQRDLQPEKRKLQSNQATFFVREKIIDPLIKAEKEDEGNVRLRVQLAWWYGEVWRETPLLQRNHDYDKRALAWAALAQKANPEGPEGYLVEYDLYARLTGKYLSAAGQLEKEAKEEPKDKKVKVTPAMRKSKQTAADSLKGKAREAFDNAAKSLRAYMKRDPTDPFLHFHLAGAFHGAGKPEMAREEAQKALRLDATVKPPRNLTSEQREQLMKMLGKESAR